MTCKSHTQTREAATIFLYRLTSQHTMKPRQYKTLLGLLSLVAILCIAPGITSNTATAQSSKMYHCTSSNPCYNICGDHVCTASELAQMKAQNAAAQKGNTTTSTTGGTTSMGSSVGEIIGGVMSYLDQASDGTQVLVRTSHPLAGQQVDIGVAFKDANNNFVQHQNYAITVSQDNQIVLSNQTAHTHSGTDTFTTSRLVSSNPLGIQVTLLGVGLPGTDPASWTGVKGEVMNFAGVTDVQTPVSTSNMTITTTPPAVPEFGSIASIVLAIAVLSIVVFTVKTRVFPKL